MLWTTVRPTQVSFQKARNVLSRTLTIFGVAHATLIVWLSPTVGFDKIQGGSDTRMTLSRFVGENLSAVSPPTGMAPRGTPADFLQLLSCKPNKVN